MATVALAATRKDGAGTFKGISLSWPAMKNGDIGGVTSIADMADATFQVEGTFGAGGSISCEGSNDGSNWHALKDAFGNAATLTAAGLIAIREVTAQVRPHVTAGDGTTSLTVTMVARRPIQ